MNDELLDLLTLHGLQSEESWLTEVGVFCLDDLKNLDEDAINGSESERPGGQTPLCED